MANTDQKPHLNVNLLVSKGTGTKLYIRLIKWALSSGRFIVVLVELVVISAFVYRYKLDSDLQTLQEKIKEQIPYIQSLKEDESVIRQTQFQLATIKNTRNSTLSFSLLLKKIAQLTPKNIRLTTISMGQPPTSAKATFTIAGQTPSNIELSTFIKALQKDPNFADITLTNISFDSGTTFTITGTIKGKGNL